jgi:hypothetical protein
VIIAGPDALVLVPSILGCYRIILERRCERESEATITSGEGRFLKMLSLLDRSRVMPDCKSSCVPL